MTLQGSKQIQFLRRAAISAIRFIWAVFFSSSPIERETEERDRGGSQRRERGETERRETEERNRGEPKRTAIEERRQGGGKQGVMKDIPIIPSRHVCGVCGGTVLSCSARARVCMYVETTRRYTLYTPPERIALTTSRVLPK